MNERRTHPRIPLEHIFYVHIVNAGQELPAVLLDISISGARIGFPPDQALPPTGSEVLFKNTSLLAELLENRAATVMWKVGVQCGVHFTPHIDASLEHIAELLQSEIYY